jgi:hypothetical protein
MIRSILKILVFAALVGGFLYFDSFVHHGHEFRAVRLAEGRVTGIFIVGAAIAVWGDKEIGGLDPISLRSIFIILGALLMIFAWVLLYELQEPSA